ncbi:MAG: hypothetical protein A2W09_02440 [Deltaproteobacteria bacterium RBG_16_50_11]|nr:MAG: hypothetical protein A2W09_02440 [Deltaproteobacteria bacterium RBG_16_50_11]
MSTRRWILLFILLMGVAVFLWKGALIRHLFTRPRKKGEKVSPVESPREKKSLVGVAGKGSIEEKIRAAVSLIGGFGPFALKGKAVLVKPNVVSYKPSPSTTNPEVVRAMVKILYEEGAKKVYVGDMSAALYLTTINNMEKAGIRKAAEEAGAEAIAFEDHGWVEVEVPNVSVSKVIVTEWLSKVDIIVNLPVIKTHRSASYSICLKNFIGCTHIRQRPYLIDSSRWEEVVAELNLAYRPHLNVVDGTVSMIEGGPWEGTAEKTGLIIASTDRVAADIVGLGVIKSFGKWERVAAKEVWDQKQIRRAIELGVGKGKGEIELMIGEGDSNFYQLIRKIKDKTGL